MLHMTSPVITSSLHTVANSIYINNPLGRTTHFPYLGNNKHYIYMGKLNIDQDDLYVGGKITANTNLN
jgi:hypothetical protein